MATTPIDECDGEGISWMKGESKNNPRDMPAILAAWCRSGKRPFGGSIRAAGLPCGHACRHRSADVLVHAQVHATQFAPTGQSCTICARRRELQSTRCKRIARHSRLPRAPTQEEHKNSQANIAKDRGVQGTVAMAHRAAGVGEVALIA